MSTIKLLNDIGATDPIYAALDKSDKAEIVRIAREGLGRFFLSVAEQTKSKETCMLYLNEAKNIAPLDQSAYYLIVQLYNKALSWAPIGSKEMMFAYADRSEAMFYTANYAECQTDVKMCLSMGCPKGLAKKLSKRSDDAKECIANKLAYNTVNNDSPSFEFLQLNFKRNVDVPCASADVTFVKRSGAKQATAGNVIKAGSVVAIERAFATSEAYKHQAITCYCCYRLTPCLHPCDNCQAMFCSSECRERSLKEYHRIECQIIGYLGLSYFETRNMLVTRTVIKLSLELGWDELVKASEDIGASRMKSATVKQTYSSKDPLSMLCYDDDVDYFEGKMFNGSIYCARVIHQLEKVPDYLPTETSKRAAATKALSRIMLHLYVTFTKTVTISNSAKTNTSNTIIMNAKTNHGWFSMTSKLRHSCEPNLIVVGLNDTVMLVALRTINKDEELTISYIGHFYLFDGGMKSPDRPYRWATELFLKTGHVCQNCVVCNEDWDKNSRTETVMTEEQELLIKNFELERIENNSEYYKKICEIIDKFPIGTVEHNTVFWGMIVKTAQLQLTNNIVI